MEGALFGDLLQWKYQKKDIKYHEFKTKFCNPSLDAAINHTFYLTKSVLFCKRFESGFRQCTRQMDSQENSLGN
jgi:hypothetical protein